MSAIQGKKLSGERIANLEKMSKCPALANIGRTVLSPVSTTPPINLSAVSLIPLNSFSAVSLTPVINFKFFGYF